MKQIISLVFLHYLRLLAKLQLLKNQGATVIGITGSAGKTSTVLATEAALKPHFKVKTSLKGGNSETGIPLSILGLNIKNYSFLSWFKIALLAPIKLLTNWQKYDLFLVEMGIDAPKAPRNMSYLLSIIKPDIGVFLNVTAVHQQFFESLDQIAQEKAKLVNTTPTAIINTSDPFVTKYTKNSHQIPIPQIKINYHHKLPDIYQLSFGAAVTVAQLKKIPQTTAKANIKKYFKLPKSRATILKGIKNSRLIDSSYNSSPLATQKLLEFLSTFPSPKIAVLGDMRELGLASPSSHKILYKKAKKYADQIISVGPETTKYFGKKAKKFLYYWQATDYLKCHPELVSGSTVLIKGSQNTIFTEEIVKALLKDKRNSSKLCRQSPYWLKLKQKFRASNP